MASIKRLALAVLLLAASAAAAFAAEQRYGVADESNNYAPGAVQMCLDANNKAVPVSSGLCANNTGGGAPVTITGNSMHKVCAPHPLTHVIPGFC